MAVTDKNAPTKTEEKKDGNNSKVAEYLQAPRKKRKRYVVIASGGGVSADLGSSIETFVRLNFKTMAVSTPRTAEELQKNFGRQIMLLILDDELLPIESLLKLLSGLKGRRDQAPIPVLFLTRQPAELVAAYHRLLAPFHEVDDYVNYMKVDRTEIFSRVRHGLNHNNARKSRRYKIDIPLDYFLLADDAMHKGRLIDLSVHGALLKAEDGRLFRVGDQVKLHMPLIEQQQGMHGDYLKLTAKVRRVFIIGDLAGISFEHLSEAKILALTEYLISMVAGQAAQRAMAKRASALRARPDRT